MTIKRPLMNQSSARPASAATILTLTIRDAGIGRLRSHWIVRVSFSWPTNNAPAPTAKSPGIPTSNRILGGR
jgi:hypothetical protein